MAKAKKASRSRSMTIPLLVVAGLAPGAARAVEGFKMDGFRGAGYRIANDFTGYDPYQKKWDVMELKYGLAPLLLGVFAHKIASKVGLNRALARTGIPLIRL